MFACKYCKREILLDSADSKLWYLAKGYENAAGFYYQWGCEFSPLDHCHIPSESYTVANILKNYET